VLRSMIAAADIVIEAARPRAFAQLGFDAAQSVKENPGLVWITITGHGAQGVAANWVGFGDDCGVAGGLSAALRAASGRTGFVGDAIADPLTGSFAALSAWNLWTAGHGGRYGIAMSNVVAHCLAKARNDDATELTESLVTWERSAGKSFPIVNHRPIRSVPALGAQTRSYLDRFQT
jgi:crotonobetainyl-CoA:carnitine CoA-transferase CaiB-like acyl-CoA transferase